MKKIKSNSLVLTSLFTAFAASLCCITPVLAVVAGVAGTASAFSWLQPFRPWMIGVTILLLAFTWHRKLKPEQEVDCTCKDEQKPPFLRSMKFLGIVTVFAVLMLAFPTYADIFFPKHQKQIEIVNKAGFQKAEFKITGMTCAGCEVHVEHEVNQLRGIIMAKASYENGNAVVEYDSAVTSIQGIKSAILKTGYEITDTKKY